jgi:hypothetical protein
MICFEFPNNAKSLLYNADEDTRKINKTKSGHMNNKNSLQKTRDPHIDSPFPVFSKPSSLYALTLSEWKIQNYFRAVYEEKVNETSRKSTIQSQKEGYVDSRKTRSVRQDINNTESLENSKDPNIYSPFPVLSELNLLIFSEQKRSMQEQNSDSILEWKFQNYFRAVNESARKSTIHSQKEEYSHQSQQIIAVQKRSRSRCKSAP